MAYFMRWATMPLIFLFGLFRKTEQVHNSCITSCLQDFLNVAGNSAGSSGMSSWQQMLQLSDNATPRELKMKFDIMCQSYSTLKFCITSCPDSTGDKHSTITNGFTSLEFVCEDRYADFLKHLPCLVKNEKVVLNQCKNETTLTTNAINSLQQAAFENKLTNLKPVLVNLCSSTNKVIACMAPITDRICGAEPSEMLKTLVRLGFKNTEILYTRLGLRDQLPDECIHLGEKPTVVENEEEIENEDDVYDNAVDHLTDSLDNSHKSMQQYNNKVTNANRHKWTTPSSGSASVNVNKSSNDFFIFILMASCFSTTF